MCTTPHVHALCCISSPDMWSPILGKTSQVQIPHNIPTTSTCGLAAQIARRQTATQPLPHHTVQATAWSSTTGIYTPVLLPTMASTTTSTTCTLCKLQKPALAYAPTLHKQHSPPPPLPPPRPSPPLSRHSPTYNPRLHLLPFFFA